MPFPANRAKLLILRSEAHYTVETSGCLISYVIFVRFKYPASKRLAMAEKSKKEPSVKKALVLGIVTILIAVVLFYFFRSI
jgi:hypothetical protein